MSSSEPLPHTFEKREQLSVFRAFSIDAIRNSHAAIKGCWLIVFTAGAIRAMQDLDSNLKCAGWFGSRSLELLNNSCSSNRLGYDILLFFIYLLTFVRFYIGSIRLFDIRYSEIYNLSSNIISTLKTTEEITDKLFRTSLVINDRYWHKFEVLILIFQSFIIVFLPYQFDNIDNFANVYIFLLIFNAVYLSIGLFFNFHKVSKALFELFPELKFAPGIGAIFPTKASLFWIFNNLTCAVLVFILISRVNYFTYLKDSYQDIVITMMYANCLLDLFFTRNFYFPTFGKMYDHLKT